MAKSGGLVTKGVRVPEGWLVLARCPVRGEWVALGTVGTLEALRKTVLLLQRGPEPEQPRSEFVPLFGRRAA